MSSKTGYQVHNKATYGRNWSADEDNYLVSHLNRLKPSAMLFLDDDGKALRTKAALPDCAVVGRLYRADIKEGELWQKRSPKDVFNDYKNTPKGIIRNILNEPDGYGNLGSLASWCAETMDYFGNANIPIVIPNWGEGNPNVDRLPELEPLWDALDKWHDLHYYGIHEYGTWRGMLFNEAGKYDVYPWRIGRFETFVVPYLQKNRHKIPNTLLTEAGCDSAHDGTPKRGWKTAWDEQRYFNELSASIDKVYKAPHYIGLCLFSWGNSGQKDTESDWISFDVSEAKLLHSKLETLQSSTPAPVPPIPPPVVYPDFPTDFEDRAVTGDFEITAAPELLMRSKPTRDSALVGRIPAGKQTLVYIPVISLKALETHSEQINGLSGTWTPVEYESYQGWVFGAYLEAVVAPPPVDSNAKRRKAIYQQIQAQLQELLMLEEGE